MKEKTTTLEEKEKEWAKKVDEMAKLEAEVDQLRSWEIHQGDFAKLVVEKVLWAIDFGELAVKMSATPINIGKQEVLKSLRLRKQQLGWDPYAKERAKSTSSNF